MSQRHVYKVISASNASDDEALLNELAKDGWVLAGGTGGNLYLMKSDGGPEGAVRKCSTCASFPETEKDSEAAKCPEWNLLMEPGGTCDKWSSRVTEKSVPDEVSAWHWGARTEIGEKRIEAITSQDNGAVVPEHKHRVVVIRGSDGSVVRGKTDLVDGHDHVILFMGMTEESDGHTHTFLLPQEA